MFSLKMAINKTDTFILFSFKNRYVNGNIWYMHI